MQKKDDPNDDLLCSFCGKSQDEVKKLIAGPSVYICDECIQLCTEIIAEEYGEEKEPELALPKPVEIKELPYKGSSEYYRPIKLSGKMYLISTEEEKLGKECKLYETNFIEKERRSGEKTFTHT